LNPEIGFDPIETPFVFKQVMTAFEPAFAIGAVVFTLTVTWLWLEQPVELFITVSV
jgi:hypothetical protein